mmetsp:Transcript_30544/g.57826  ORF Transcript_30544/g.57826 Transcript_30544/m.57826 type:complete len:143 (+) Transcript_30544:830-1258(+)
MCSLVTFRNQLSGEDGGKDLRLSSSRDGRPRIRGTHGGEGFKADVTGKHAREVESGSVEKVSSGGNHGNTAVLELSGTEPEEGLVTSPCGKAKGIEVGKRGRRATDVIETKGDLGAHTLCRRKRHRIVLDNWPMVKFGKSEF